MSNLEINLLEMHKRAASTLELCTKETMRELERELERIERRLFELNNEMRSEALICRQELEERLELGLTGDAAIQHYNDYMEKHEMYHLMITDSEK